MERQEMICTRIPQTARSTQLQMVHVTEKSTDRWNPIKIITPGKVEMLQEIRVIQHSSGQGSENLGFLTAKMHFLKYGNTIFKKLNILALQNSLIHMKLFSPFPTTSSNLKSGSFFCASKPWKALLNGMSTLCSCNCFPSENNIASVDKN